MQELLVGSIKKHSESKNKIFVPPELFHFFQKGQQITVHYGKAQAQASVHPLEQSNRLALSANIWNRLSIPFAHQLHFRVEHDHLYIGPLVGIFTSGIHPYSKQLVGKRTSLMQHYLAAQQDIPASYFLFGPNDIAYNQRKIRGYFLIKTKERKYWQRYTIPFPDVVFNKIPNRTSENLPSVVKGKDVLNAHGVKLFNPEFFNKWKLYQATKHVKQIQKYIPETTFNPTEETLKKLLRTHRMIYLKPAGGSLGLGIIQLIDHPKHGLLARFRGMNSNRLKRFSSLSSALRYFFNSKSLKRYIAQQGIALIQIQGRPIDFRVHTNKDRQGKWRMTAIAGKMAGKGSVTTHVRTGGEVLSANQILKHCFPDSAKQVLERLEHAVLSLSEAIDHNVPGYIGELGFDIGIDQDGHPWMFEANSKPGRHVFAHHSMRESDRLTRKMILEYALYLTNSPLQEVH